MSAASGPRRRHVSFKEDVAEPIDESDVKKKSAATSDDQPLSWIAAFFMISVSRLISARINLVHDCDETFNYWEPLHYLVHGYGMQTWEYSSEFGLRSYLYLLLHAVFAWPASLLHGDGVYKVQTFFFLRSVLGAVSAATEAALCVSVSRRFGRRMGSYTLLLLFGTSGCFTASTTFLPSTFSMYAITLSVALYLDRRPRLSVAIAAAGVLIGWPFAVLATVPIVLACLVGEKDFVGVFLSGALTSIATLAISILTDRYFYGRWVCSVWNLVHYNVWGGGDSALYGVEGPLFYFWNLANNFNLALPLALVLPVVLMWLRKEVPGGEKLLVAVLPFYLWLGFMSMQAHKEERFMYVVYPLICLGAAATVSYFPSLIPHQFRDPQTVSVPLENLAKILRPLTLAVVLGLSYCRGAALSHHYSAPIRVYRQLGTLSSSSSSSSYAGGGGAGTITVCVGSEWHRFPSSFFLPSPRHRLAFLDDGFRGLLPAPFNATAGGSAAAPPHLNRQNEYSPLQFLEEEESCAFLVELDLKRSDRSLRGTRGDWQEAISEPFLDAEQSSSFTRAFHIPGISDKYNVYGDCILFKRPPTT